MDEFRNRLMQIMHEKKITKAELFKLSHLKKSTFYNIFNEKTDPNNLSIDTVLAITKVLDTTPEFLIYGDESKRQRKTEYNKKEDVVDLKMKKNKIRIFKRGGGVEEYEVADDEIELWERMLKANKEIKEKHKNNNDF